MYRLTSSLPQSSRGTRAIPLRNVRRQIVARSRGGDMEISREALQKFVDTSKQFKRKRIETEQLKPEVRESVTNAIKDLRYESTVGDVASKTGLPPFESERALQALAADSAASIVVGPSGDLLYRFDRDFDTKILNKSFTIRTLQPLVEKAAGLAQWVGRFAFGSALLASLAVVAYAAVIAQRSDSDNRRRNNDGWGGGGFDLFFNPFRAIQIWLDPYYGYNPYYYAAMGYEPEPMTFPEAVFSFVFGDPDPNLGLQKKLYQMLAAYIKSRGGVVTAEEVIPFLPDPGAALAGLEGRGPGAREDIVVRDEAPVLEAVTRFGGKVESDGEGNLVYVFPELQATAGKPSSSEKALPKRNHNPGKWTAKGWVEFVGTRGAEREREREQVERERDRLESQASSSSGLQLPMEAEREFSGAAAGQKVMVVFLGILNLLGVGWLSGQLASPMFLRALAYNGAGFIVGLAPFLQAYALSFIVIPAARWVWTKAENARIDARNRDRVAALEKLAEPSKELQARLKAAQALAERRVIRAAEGVYDTSKELGAQGKNLELEDFDRRLTERAGNKVM